MKKNIKKMSNPILGKVKQEIREIKKDLKRLKKSKKRMQLLWYRTKKEHVALIADLDKRLKALKKRTAKKAMRAKRVVRKAIGKKTRARKSILKPMRKKARARKQIKKIIIKKTPKNNTPAKNK